MNARLASIIVVAVAALVLQAGNAFSQQDTSCQSHGICVHPGDHLKYQINFGSASSSQTYTFGDMVDDSDIKVTEQYSDQNKTENSNFILNVNTGYMHDEQNTANMPFLQILPAPISYNKSSTVVTQQLHDFNGFKRTALVTTQTGVNGSFQVKYDVQTGVLLNEHFVGVANFQGKPVMVESSNDLVDTNLINSDSIVTETPKSTTAIPSWIKNNAKWWSEGTIGDSEFVKAIQYLVSNGIIQVSHDSSQTAQSQQIPSWIRNNAGWWADGTLGDEDFIKAIQYLINSGIIKV